MVKHGCLLLLSKTCRQHLAAAGEALRRGLSSVSGRCCTFNFTVAKRFHANTVNADVEMKWFSSV